MRKLTRLSTQRVSEPHFNCLYCGRFAHYEGRYDHYNGEFNDIIITWTCKKCGYCEEGTQ